MKIHFFRVGRLYKRSFNAAQVVTHSRLLITIQRQRAFQKMRGIVVFALVGLFLGCALQAVKSRERIPDSTDDEFNGIEPDEQELTSPDEFYDEYSAVEDDNDGLNDDNDESDDLDVEVKPADPFDDDDDDDEDQNDEELGEYQR